MTSFTSRYGNPAVDYKGAHVRAHFRHVATVSPRSAAASTPSNVDHLTDFVQRFVLADSLSFST